MSKLGEKMKFYSYSKCSTCRDAKKFLDLHAITYEEKGIVDNPPSVKDLKAMLDIYEGNIKKIINTSGMVYKELGLKDKINEMSVSEVNSDLVETLPKTLFL